MFVTGCHRSGTSLLASLLEGFVTGLAPGERQGDLDLKLENPLGFFESQRLVETNDALLSLMDASWDRPPVLPVPWDQPGMLAELQPFRGRLAHYALQQAWIDKDPRLCLTYPAFRHILLRRVPLIVALRDPLSVAVSMHARNGFPLNRGLCIWLLYNLHLSAQLVDGDLVLTYADLLELKDASASQPMRCSIEAFLEAQELQRPSNEQWARVLAQCLRPQFNRAEGACPPSVRDGVNQSLLDLCQVRYQQVVDGLHAGQPASQLMQESFLALPYAGLALMQSEHWVPESDLELQRSRQRDYQRQCEGLQCSIDILEQRIATSEQLQQEQQLRMAALQTQLQDSEQRCDHLQNQQRIALLAERESVRRLKAFEASRSWRLTAPLRSVLQRWRGTG